MKEKKSVWLASNKTLFFNGETRELCEIENTHTKHTTKLRWSLI